MQTPQYDRGKVGAYLGLGAGFAGSAILFAVLGMLLDRKIGTTPVFTLLGVFVGGAAGFYHLVRRAIALGEGDGSKEQENDTSEPT